MAGDNSRSQKQTKIDTEQQTPEGGDPCKGWGQQGNNLYTKQEGNLVQPNSVASAGSNFWSLTPGS